MKRRWTLTVMIIALLLILSGPTLASAALTNTGMLTLRDGLMAQDDLVPGTYPHYNVLPDSLTTARAMRSLRRAVALNGDSLPARWALGRAALVAGEGQAAADALNPLTERATRSPLLYLDTLWALSYGGRPDGVVTLYEAVPPPQRTQAVSDTVALAYLQSNRGAGEQGKKYLLERAKELRSGDLYVNYHLWKRAHGTGDMQTAATYSETLSYFPLEAVHPTDERLLDYATKVIPALLEDGVWNRGKTLNVVSFLVWQYNEVTGVERLLEQLIECYPTEPDWPFYLAELYHRRGDLGQADIVYRQVLEIDPDYTQAYLRLGIVAEARYHISNSKSQTLLEDATRWYEQYHEIAPNDLFGLKKLVEVYECLDRPETMTLWEELETKADDRRVVAELLDMPIEDVRLGPNLVENGGFEDWLGRDPKWWRWSDMATGTLWNRGAFIGSVDSLSWIGVAARVEGFWIQTESDLEPGRTGFWQWDEDEGSLYELELRAGKQYLLSFYYRTERISSQAVGIWLSYDHRALFAGYHWLVPTNGEWRRFMIVGQNKAELDRVIYPLVSLWNPGEVWFDNMVVREVIASE